MFHTRPAGLTEIMDVLHKRGTLATREQIMSGEFYGPPKQKSTLGWLASGLYSSTVGMVWGSSESQETKPSETQDFVSIELLDRQADMLVKWASNVDQYVHSEQKLKKILRTTTPHSDADINLLLTHMKHTNRI
jgi:hypothetical protein